MPGRRKGNRHLSELLNQMKSEAPTTPPTPGGEGPNENPGSDAYIDPAEHDDRLRRALEIPAISGLLKAYGIWMNAETPENKQAMHTAFNVLHVYANRTAPSESPKPPAVSPRTPTSTTSRRSKSFSGRTRTTSSGPGHRPKSSSAPSSRRKSADRRYTSRASGVKEGRIEKSVSKTSIKKSTVSRTSSKKDIVSKMSSKMPKLASLGKDAPPAAADDVPATAQIEFKPPGRLEAVGRRRGNQLENSEMTEAEEAEAKRWRKKVSSRSIDLQVIALEKEEKLKREERLKKKERELKEKDALANVATGQLPPSSNPPPNK